MSDASPAKIVVHGAPHPLTRAAFLYLKTLVEAANGPELQLVTVGRDPLTIGGERGLYLRSTAIDTLSVQRPERPDAPIQATLAAALLRRLDARWHDFPTLLLEDALQGDLTALEFLAKSFHLVADNEVITAARTAFTIFRAAGTDYGDPASYLAALDTDGAEDDLVMHAARLYPTFACEGGVPALIEGWMAPDQDGCWLVQPRGLLRIYLRERAALITCVFQPLPETASFKALVDGMETDVIVRREDSATILSFPIFTPDTGAKAACLSIELLLNDLSIIAETGIKLRALRLDPLPSRKRQKSKSALPWHLGKAGFVRRPWTETPEIPPFFQAPLSAAHLLAGRLEDRLLIVTDTNARPDPALLAHPDIGLIVSAHAAPSEAPADSGEAAGIQTFEMCNSTTFPTLEALVDRIHFHRISDVFDPATLSAWAAAQLSFRGLMSGVEASSEATMQLIAALTRGGASRELTFIVEGASWVAVPVAYWKH